LSVITQTTPPEGGYDVLYVQLEWENKKKESGDQKSVVGWGNFREIITCNTEKKMGL
jgi:hypothetical protein